MSACFITFNLFARETRVRLRTAGLAAWIGVVSLTDIHWTFGLIEVECASKDLRGSSRKPEFQEAHRPGASVRAPATRKLHGPQPGDLGPGTATRRQGLQNVNCQKAIVDG